MTAVLNIIHGKLMNTYIREVLDANKWEALSTYMSALLNSYMRPVLIT